MSDLLYREFDNQLSKIDRFVAKRAFIFLNDVLMEKEKMKTLRKTYFRRYKRKRNDK